MKADQAGKLDTFKKMTDTEKEHEYVSLLDQYDELEALYCENTNTVTVLVKEIIKRNAKLENKKKNCFDSIKSQKTMRNCSANASEVLPKDSVQISLPIRTMLPATRKTILRQMHRPQTTEQEQDKGDANTPEEKENENKPVTNNTRRSHKGNPNKQ